jgi:hypothetical protein
MVAGGNFGNIGLSAASHAFGIHGGCGLELILTSRGCWFIEVQGRYARFKDFSGLKVSLASPFGLPVREHVEGDLYYIEHKLYPRLDIFAGAPPPGSGARRFAYDLKSVSAWTGIRVKF